MAFLPDILLLTQASITVWFDGIIIEMTIYHTSGVFSYLPHHLRLGWSHSTCMSVLARRRAIMGLGLGLGYHGVVSGFLACCHGRWGGRWVLGGGVVGGFLAVG